MLASSDSLLLGLAAIVVAGVVAQWIAWRARFPSILLLLVCGFLAGPEVFGLIDADELFGETLLPLVSVSVAILLFEGGLTLRFHEIGGALRVVLKLVTLGALITWILTAAAAYWMLGFDLRLATLIGAVLIVTGPTVVSPLLRQIRPTGAVGPILQWEGILIDPVGAVAAVLVFEGITSAAGTSTAGIALGGVLKTLVAGGGLGFLGAGIMMLMLERYWLPDFLHSTASLATTIAVYTAANAVQHDAGLLSATLMGVVLANQRRVSVHHILEFKENLRVLLISSLFLLLASRVKMADLARVDVGRVGFLFAILFVVRPLAVFACTVRSGLAFRERLFLACLAPRGIVAAAIASVFALRLENPEILTTTFVVIAASIAFYGLLAAPIARRLGLSQPNAQGILFLGASHWVRDLGALLTEHKVRVLLVDTNGRKTRDARMAGIPALHGNLLSEDTDEHIDLQGLGRLIATTHNDDVNALAALHFREDFGRREVYQVAPSEAQPPSHLRGRFLAVDHDRLAELFDAGARFKATRLSKEFPFKSWLARYGDEAIPVLAIADDGTVVVATKAEPFQPGPGTTIVGLVPNGQNA